MTAKRKPAPPPATPAPKAPGVYGRPRDPFTLRDFNARESLECRELLDADVKSQYLH